MEETPHSPQPDQIKDTATPAIKPLSSTNPWNRLSKNQKIALATGSGILVIGLLSYAAWAYHRQRTQPACTPDCSTTTPTASPTSSPTATPTQAVKVPSLLNGVLVDQGQQNIHPLAVMIENHPDARPQSGLGQADLVYEAIAEGGITRFMAVFANPQKPVKVGPIRSARTYFVDFATELNAFYAHVGGNADALDQIKATNVLDLDQFSIGEPVYKREFTRPVALEHTMYSSTDKLWNYAVDVRHYPKTDDFQPWQFQDDPPADKRPANQKVTVSVSDSLYSVTWTYNPADNSYSREMAGAPHIDADTNQQIKAKTIILETVDRKPTVTRSNESGWIYTLTGNGAATVIENGTATPATWKKEGTGRTRYYDSSGKEIALERGTIWVHLVHTDSKITY